jgi:hypothetical protein
MGVIIIPGVPAHAFFSTKHALLEPYNMKLNVLGMIAGVAMAASLNACSTPEPAATESAAPDAMSTPAATPDAMGSKTPDAMGSKAPDAMGSKAPDAMGSATPAATGSATPSATPTP